MTAYEITDNPHCIWPRGGDFHAWAQHAGALVSNQEVPEMVWVDMETSGLDEKTDVPLELGIILTDRAGRVIPNGAISWLIFDIDRQYSVLEVRENCKDVVREMHDKSGLWADMDSAVKSQRPYGLEPRCVQADVRNWLTNMCRGVTDWNGEKQAPLSGSGPHFDRKFLAAYMPRLEKWFHYRNGADVSAVRNLQRMHRHGIPEPEKREAHRPLPDLVDSITLYRHQLVTFLKVGPKTMEML